MPISVNPSLAGHEICAAAPRGNEVAEYSIGVRAMMPRLRKEKSSMDTPIEPMPRADERLVALLAAVNAVEPYLGILAAQHYLTEQQALEFAAAIEQAREMRS
jgi:hypothetical protein